MRLLCKLGIHKWGEIEIHYHESPKAVAVASVLERCSSCNTARIIRYNKTVSLIVSLKYLSYDLEVKWYAHFADKEKEEVKA